MVKEHLKPKPWVKIGSNYLVDESEMEKRFEDVFLKQHKFYIEKVYNFQYL